MSTAIRSHRASRPERAERAAHGAVWVMLRHTLRDRTPFVTVLSALMIGMGLLVGALWPSLQDTLAEMQASLPDVFLSMLAGADMSTASGWANAEMMTMVAPGGVIAVAVVSGSRLTAGEEEAKTMGMLLGAPVPRSTFLWARLWATALLVVVVSAAVGAGLMLGSLVGGMDLSAWKVAAVCAHAAALGWLFGAVAIALGAMTGRSRLTSAVTAGLAVFAFAAASFLPLSQRFAGAAEASPWYYYNSSNPLTNGVDASDLAVLCGLAVSAAAASLVLFSRRDLRG